MTEQSLQDTDPADEDLRAGADEHEAEEQGSEAQHSAGESAENPEGDEARRPPRPGKMERRLARFERELESERAAAAEARRQAAHYQRALAEANEAGHKLMGQRLAGDIERAQGALQDAIVANDAEAIVKAQTAVSRLTAAEAQLRAQPAPRAPAPEPQEAFTPTTKAWMQANPWYGSDPGLTSLAKAVHAQAERRGIAVDTPEYWAFIERGVSATAPGVVKRPAGAKRPAPAAEQLEDEDEQDETPPARSARPGAGAPVARGAPRAPATSASAPTRLSPAEAEAARVCGLTPQEYRQEQAKLLKAGRIKEAR
jgi:hypothetical protein